LKSIMLLFHKKTENHEAEEAGLRLSKRIPFTLSKALYLALLFVLLIILMLSIYSFFNPDMHYYQLDMSFKGLAIVLLLLFLISIYLVVRRVCNVGCLLIMSGKKFIETQTLPLQDFCVFRMKYSLPSVNYFTYR